MKRFKLTLFTEQIIEADDEEEAIENLEEKLIPQIENEGFQGIFKIKYEEILVKKKKKS